MKPNKGNHLMGLTLRKPALTKDDLDSTADHIAGFREELRLAQSRGEQLAREASARHGALEETLRTVLDELRSLASRLPAAEPAPPAPPAAAKGDGAGAVLKPATSQVLKPAKASRARIAPKDGPA